MPYVLIIETSKISLSYTRPPTAEETTGEPEKAKKKKRKKTKKAKIELEDYLACEDGTDPVENPYDRYVHICASLCMVCVVYSACPAATELMEFLLRLSECG